MNPKLEIKINRTLPIFLPVPVFWKSNVPWPVPASRRGSHDL